MSKLPAPRRLVAFDLDGTVLHNGQPMSRRTISMLEAARQQGCLLAVSTGRAWETLPAGLAAQSAIDYLILANGAQLRKAGSGETLLSRPLSGALAQELMADYSAAWYVFLEDSFFFEWKTLTGQLTNRSGALPIREVLSLLRGGHIRRSALRELQQRGLPPVSKLEPIFPTRAAQQEAVARLRARGDLAVVPTAGCDLELTAAGVDKGSAVTALAQRHGLTKEQIICFGDSTNDLSMAQAGFFVAMGNAREEVKAVAHAVTAPVWEDGFAAYLEEWLTQQ